MNADRETVTRRSDARVVSARGSSKLRALEAALEQAGFWTQLARRVAETGRSPGDLRLVVKPNLMMFRSRNEPSVITDPELVQHLFSLLFDHGYRHLALVESENVYGNWFRNRDVRSVARAAGYDDGGLYRIVNLTESRRRYAYTLPDGQTWRHYVGAEWADADFRISFAKCKTHVSQLLTLSLKNIFGTAPLRDKFRHYHVRSEVSTVVAFLVTNFPVHFALVDAITASDGVLGFATQKNPKHPGLILASPDPLALDVALARHLGVDPTHSRVIAEVARWRGWPDPRWQGPSDGFEGWKNVPQSIADVYDVEEECYGLSSIQSALMTTTMDLDAFPPRNPILRVYYRLVLWLSRVGDWLTGRRSVGTAATHGRQYDSG